jgi:hypothetical protein
MAVTAKAQSSLSEGYAREIAPLAPTERVGSEVWFNATAFNDRFFTYGFQQRVGGLIDWYGILAADKKKDIFQAWGGIPDPDCCVPGAPNCPAKSLGETYGFQWCPGDDVLLQYIGKYGYPDPACDLKDVPAQGTDQRQSACDLHFGTSTGILGLRKFPNPRFNRSAWLKLNGDKPESWEGYRGAINVFPTDAQNRASRLFDGSIEPPYRIGMACGACHIGYKPDKPPADPNHPAWENIDGLVGNQYSRVSNILGSGFGKHALEWQLIARARPGIVDTSALPMDYVSNPGTMNAIINFKRRPLHEHEILKWRRAEACPAGTPAEKCWCEPRQARQMLGALDQEGAAAEHPERRRGFDRHQGGDPARLLQYRLMLGAMLAQPYSRSARRRSQAAQLRPDAFRHWSMPARLRQLPRHRGSS